MPTRFELVGCGAEPWGENGGWVRKSGKGRIILLPFPLEMAALNRADSFRDSGNCDAWKVYRDGTMERTDTVNPSYTGTYSLSFTGTSGTDAVVVTLDDQEYMYLNFDYDNQTVTVTQTIPFQPQTSSGGEEEPSSSSTEEEEPSSGTEDSSSSDETSGDEGWTE